MQEWRAKRQLDWSLDPHRGYKAEYYGITIRGLSWHYEEWSGSFGDVNFKNIKFDSNMIFINEFGWPFRCIAEEQWLEVREPEHAYLSSETYKAFGAPAPNRVLWTGMFINVLYYCFSIALALLCWSYIRRGLRQMQGRCIKCSYDLRGSSTGCGCPECAMDGKLRRKIVLQVVANRERMF